MTLFKILLLPISLLVLFPLLLKKRKNYFYSALVGDTPRKQYLRKRKNVNKESMTPVFRRKDGFCFKIFSNEEERKHIHVIKAECEAKFWLEPSIELAENYGFTTKELKKITQIVEQYGNEFKHQFAEHIGKRVDD